MKDALRLAGRDAARLKEIAQVASRFGLDVLLARMGLARGGRGDSADAPVDAADLPRRTRLALESLGPTYVKLGQILATRTDLLPPAWIGELEQLHSSAPTLDFDLLRQQVADALGQQPEDAFASFDPVPLAAASMAQVHRATLHDGTAIVLKIRRPGIRPLMEADLRLIARLASVVEAASAEARRFAPRAMARQLAEAVLEELDFTTEGRNADRMRADFSREPRVVVPAIHWEFSSETLLAMDYVAGTPPRDGDTLRAAGIDPAAIAALGADVVLDMVLINGRFHGDPHPGNLLCLPGNRIALLDLGLIGYVSPRRREEFVSFVQALGSKDTALLADVLERWSEHGDVPRDRIDRAAEALIRKHGDGPLVLGIMVADFMALMRAEGLAMPPELLLIFKALVTIDGVLTAIEPGFDLTAAMRRASARIALARLSPDHWLPLLQALGWELARIGDDAPRLVRAAIRRLDDPTRALVAPVPQSGSKWIPLSVMAGALIVAAAILFR